MADAEAEVEAEAAQYVRRVINAKRVGRDMWPRVVVNPTRRIGGDGPFTVVMPQYMIDKRTRKLYKLDPVRGRGRGRCACGWPGR
jgi:hypothetical protein